MTISITGMTSRAGGTSGVVAGKTSTGAVTSSAVAGKASGVMTSGVMSRSRTSSDGLTAQNGFHSLWLTLETIDSLASAGKRSALSLELAETDGGESRSGVNDGLLMMHLVDRNGGVDDGGLDNLLLKNRLNGLVD